MLSILLLSAKVRWILCAGHSGVLGNECANALAGQAKTESILTLDPATAFLIVYENIEAVGVD